MDDIIENKDKALSYNLSEYSNDFIELYRKQPLWIVRWGIFLISVAIVVLLIFSYYIKYPETINADMVITSKQYSTNLSSLKEGHIMHILINDNEIVKKDEPLLVLRTDANYKDILWLNNEMKSNKNIESLKQSFEKKQFNVGNIIEHNLSNFILLVNKKAPDNEIKTSFTSLKFLVNKWIQKNMIISPIKGNVNYLTLIYEGRPVKRGEELLKIGSVDKAEPKGGVLVSAKEISKVIKNQKVLIKVDNYSYEKFGILEGKINNVSQVPNKEGYYYVSINLPKYLVTSTKKKIPFNRDLFGNAEIIISNKNILTRFVQQFTSSVEMK